MPASLTYPGVYVEEISSGVRTITGVATSITAFIGRAQCGPTDKPVTINNFGDYERIFGGLDLNSTMSYAVRDFYLNGGSQAVIVRVFGNGAAKASMDVQGLQLEAASEGSWGNSLYVLLDVDVSGEVAQRIGLTKKDLFNLTVIEGKVKFIDHKVKYLSVKNTERYLNVTVKGNSERRIDKILAEQSSLIRYKKHEGGTWSESIPLGKDLEAAWDAKVAFDSDNNSINKDDFEKKQQELYSATITACSGNTTGKDGLPLQEAAFIGTGRESGKTGIYQLEKVDLFNLLCIPPYQDNIESDLIDAAITYCEKRRAIFLLDPPSDWESIDGRMASKLISDKIPKISRHKNAAQFFPRLKQPNPMRGNQIEEFSPCGAIAGIMARTDTQRGVWKAPAGIDATLKGVPELSVKLTDAENGQLNQLGINCLRSFPNVGRVVWGARTLEGSDQNPSEWKYLPVRRTALFIEESLYRGTQWVVFEPNDEPLWAQIRLNVGAFMHNLFRQGAFQGTSPKEAYFVKCDKETNPQNDIDRGIVNILVGFAPLKPAEFVVVKLQQIAGNLEV